MIFEVIRRSMFGISFAGIMTFLALTLMTIQEIQVPVSEIWLNMLGSIIIGVYFGVASLLFDIEHWSLLKQFLIHFLLSLLVFHAVAVFLTGWIPVETIALLIGVIVFIVTYIICMSAAYIYLKRVEQAMNGLINK